MKKGTYKKCLNCRKKLTDRKKKYCDVKCKNLYNNYNLCSCGRVKCERSKKCKVCIKEGNHRKLSHVYKFSPVLGYYVNKVDKK